jgi:hypothetical protein
VNCILKKCAHGSSTNPSNPGSPCHALGECGASYALAKAREPEGYEVLSHANLTIVSLVKAGLATAVRTNDGTLIVKAMAPGQAERERKAKLAAERPARHSWGLPVRFAQKTERQCLSCRLVKVTFHEIDDRGHDRCWTEWYRGPDQTESRNTPACEVVSAEGRAVT